MISTPRNSTEESQAEASSGSASVASPSREKSSWKEWSGRDEDGDGYKFGDFSRGMLSSLQAGVRELKHRAADTALSLKEGHEQRAVDFVRELAQQDDAVRDIAQSTISSSGSAGTSAERFWCSLCRDAHSDHKQEYDEAESTEGAIGTLCVKVLEIGSEPALVRADGSNATKPVILLCLRGRRSGGLLVASNQDEKVVNSAQFRVKEVIGSDLGVYLFDRGSAKFQMGSEDKAFCGGCLVPLTMLIQRSAGAGLGSGIYSSCSGQRFQAQLTVELLSLEVVRGKWKLEHSELTGAKMPTARHGTVKLDLKLSLNEPPMKLYFHLADPSMFEKHTLAENKGHVSDPFSVLKAAANAVGRVGWALKMESWKAAADELRDSQPYSILLTFWWSLGMLWAPVWTWPLLLVLLLLPFAWKVNCVAVRTPANERLRLYVEEDGEPSKDLMKEAVKVQLNIMQLTENVNKAAAHLERVKFIVSLEDRCLSSICFLVILAAALLLAACTWVLQLLLDCGAWRYLLWLPGTCALLPRALRAPVFDAVAKAEAYRQQLLGDDLERMLAGLWQRIPDGVEASHLHLCKHYVLTST